MLRVSFYLIIILRMGQEGEKISISRNWIGPMCLLLLTLLEGNTHFWHFTHSPKTKALICLIQLQPFRVLKVSRNNKIILMILTTTVCFTTEMCSSRGASERMFLLAIKVEQVAFLAAKCRRVLLCYLFPFRSDCRRSLRLRRKKISRAGCVASGIVKVRSWTLAR